MTNPRHQAPSTPNTDLTSTTIMLATCAFVLLSLATSTETPTVALVGALSLGAAMTMSSKMLGHHSLQVTSPR
ncbi:hypothetical protein [Nocardia sp. XZ_19_231]|uniref:hypothetical protein n=1 Tax=Nocardia sp. XZ_19_231 TaxID=2769252 RepID=UPI00188E5E02|nr:hypothetical protein [Nocardia sp. XZ_19_231]